MLRNYFFARDISQLLGTQISIRVFRSEKSRDEYISKKEEQGCISKKVFWENISKLNKESIRRKLISRGNEVDFPLGMCVAG